MSTQLIAEAILIMICILGVVLIVGAALYEIFHK